MQNVSFWHRVLKIVSLVVVSAGIGLHVSLQYQSLLLAGLVCIALIVIDVICIRVIWPHHASQAHAAVLQTTQH
jgi:uncharacterized membrane protein